MKIHIIISVLVGGVLAQGTADNSPRIQPVPILPSANSQKEEKGFQASSRTANPNMMEFEEGFDPLEDEIIGKQQRREQNELEKKEIQRFKPWLSSQFQAMNGLTDIVTHEMFSFKISDEYTFRWNPSKRGNFHLVIEVFQYSGQFITLPDKPGREDFVRVLAMSAGSNTYLDIGVVYIKRVFQLNFHTDYQEIKIINNNDKPMLIQVGLEVTNFVPESGVDDDQFTLTAQKIKSILGQLEETQLKREALYKTQWSFHDRQEQHQSEMLILTGIQLMVILGTAIVQMCCIKGLLDNRLIV